MRSGAGVQAISDKDQSRALMWAGVVLVLGVHRRRRWPDAAPLAVDNWITAGARVQQLLIRRAADLGADLPKQVATGEVVAASANDVERIGNAFDILPRMVGAVIAFFVVAVDLDRSATSCSVIIVLIGVPLLSSGVAPLVRPLERREREQRVHLGMTQELAADTVAGLRVLRGIGGEDLFLARFHAESQKVQAPRSALRGSVPCWMPCRCSCLGSSSSSSRGSARDSALWKASSRSDSSSPSTGTPPFSFCRCARSPRPRTSGQLHASRPRALSGCFPRPHVR